jgi:RNA polymerase sigma factor (sigma-70 family)
MIDSLTDAQSLTDFSRTRSPEAFAVIVRRYADLVYSTAARMVDDAHLAEDVAQAAFIVLAKKADRVNPRTLPGWLVNATRLAAREAIRSKRTRTRYETQAAQMRRESSMPPEEPTTAEVLPLLDEALSRLGEADRTAVVLRFLQGLNFAQISAATGASEDAARKRVSRAVEKLRAIFIKKGIIPSVGGLMLVLASQQAKPASAAMVSTITAAATKGGTGNSALIAKGAGSMMTWATIKTVVVAAACLLVMGVLGVGIEMARFIQAAPATTASAMVPTGAPPWVHVRYDTGQVKEEWTNLQTGESYARGFDGRVVYINEQSNTRLVYWKQSGVIDQDTPTLYAPGQLPKPWTPQSAWGEFVGPFEHSAAATQPAGSPPPPVVIVHDSLNGVAAVRFDDYNTDSQGIRFLYSQLWADPRTRLPIRIKTRLQLGERETTGKEWSIGDYDFPRTGPADFFALGVPRDTPINRTDAPVPIDVQAVLDAINRSSDGFLKNYRAVVINMSGSEFRFAQNLDVIWRDGDKIREDYHLPGMELQSNPYPPSPQLTPDSLFSWASQHEPYAKHLMDSMHEYDWDCAAAAKATEPRVQIFIRRHATFAWFNTGCRPEDIQWPTRHDAPHLLLLAASAATPAGCIGLRTSDVGNTRTDYYVDPQNDYVCVKQVGWNKRGIEWLKTSERTLSALHRVAGHVVANTQKTHNYDNPLLGTVDDTYTTTIDVVPLTAADYPPGTFDPASLVTGANVIGY